MGHPKDILRTYYGICPEYGFDNIAPWNTLEYLPAISLRWWRGDIQECVDNMLLNVFVGCTLLYIDQCIFSVSLFSSHCVLLTGSAPTVSEEFSSSGDSKTEEEQEKRSPKEKGGKDKDRDRDDGKIV